MRYALKFGYDGTVFQGYARQPGKRTVEEDIIGAMKSLGILKDGDEFRPGSRTDRGVSAAGNVIVIGTDKDSRGIIPGLNSELDDIVFHGIARVDEVFNPPLFLNSNNELSKCIIMYSFHFYLCYLKHY